jgi:dipeptidyl aminopeptidase/acylaminoacyl peptidase
MRSVVFVYALISSVMLALSILPYTTGLNHSVHASQLDKGIFSNNYVLTKYSNTTDFGLTDWSHDGNFVVGMNDSGIYSLNLASGDRNELFSILEAHQLDSSNQTVTFEDIFPPRLSYSDNSLLFYGQVHIDGVYTAEGFRYDIKNQTLTKLTDNLPVVHDPYPNTVGPKTWFPDGNILLVESITENDDPDTSRFVMWLADPNGQKQKQLLTVKSEPTWPEVSADGRKIVFFRTEPSDSDYYRDHFLMVYDVDNEKLSEVPDFSFTSTSTPLRLSPNGELVLFSFKTYVRSPFNDIHVASVDGKLHENIFPPEFGAPSLPLFSPDGKTLIFNPHDPYDESKSGLYLLEFAHPMPEFGSVPAMLIATTIVVSVGLGFRMRFFHN